MFKSSARHAYSIIHNVSTRIVRFRCDVHFLSIIFVIRQTETSAAVS